MLTGLFIKPGPFHEGFPESSTLWCHEKNITQGNGLVQDFSASTLLTFGARWILKVWGARGEGYCPVHCRMLSTTPGLHPLPAPDHPHPTVIMSLDIAKCHLEGRITPSWEPLGWRIMGWGLKCLSEHDLPRSPFLRYHCGPYTPISLQSHFLLRFLHSPCHPLGVSYFVCLFAYLLPALDSGSRNWIWLPHHSISNTCQCLHEVGVQQMGGSY